MPEAKGLQRSLPPAPLSGQGVHRRVSAAEATKQYRRGGQSEQGTGRRPGSQATFNNLVSSTVVKNQESKNLDTIHADDEHVTLIFNLLSFLTFSKIYSFQML